MVILMVLNKVILFVKKLYRF